MNNPVSPNKFTALLMIILGVSLLFLAGIAYQSYQTDRAIYTHTAKTLVNAKLLKDINDTKHRNEILLLAQNEEMKKDMVIFNTTLNKVMSMLKNHSDLLTSKK